ncbi:hypothetical protein GOBAR_AA07943 [Gossypium barbadense]|uniref:MULE transposase domain-containing protein n=1 Tax=Gossypium barbadense TaxID=3634 RepID=A0A2P5YAX5_GOSBA|nr:hypothetical protein GOBAR_AA07943 [Gossypium barbadense]
MGIIMLVGGANSSKHNFVDVYRRGILHKLVKHKEIDLYVEHEIAIFTDDDLMLAVATVESAGDGNESVDVAGSKDREGVEVVGSKNGEGVEGLGREGIEVAGSQSGKSGATGQALDGLDASVEGVEEANDEGLEDESDSDSEDENVYLMKFEVEVPEIVEGKELNDRVGREEEGNETEYFDSDDHGSILRSNDDDNTDAYHFEATIRDHPKMKLRKIQRRVALEMHVNVNMTRCKRAKKMAKDKLARNFVEEFAMLWDYVDELRLKNPRSTIKMAVNRITPESPGLEIAINDILPRVEHKNCVRHVLLNYYGRKKAKAFEFAFWKIVKSTTERM